MSEIKVEVKPKKHFDNIWCFLFAVFCICWFLLPMGCGPYPQLTEGQLEILYPFSLPFNVSKYFHLTFLNLSMFSVYLIPAAAAFFIAAGFLKVLRKKKILLLTAEITVTIMLYCSIVCFLNSANTLKWFFEFPIAAIFTNVAAIIMHITLSACQIRSIRSSNPEYQVYRDFRMSYNTALKEQRQKNRLEKAKEKERSRSQDLDNTKRNTSILRQKELKEENKRLRRRTYLRAKVIASFLSIISCVLFLLGFGLLSRYHQLMMESIGDAGRTQAEQAAAVFRSGGGSNQPVLEFFQSREQTNSRTHFPFERIDIFSEVRPIIYLKNISVDTVFPNYRLAYTTARVSSIPKDEKVLYSENARKYFDHYQRESSSTPVFNKANGTCKYICPVTMLGTSGRERFMGFSVVTYREDVLMRPYFQTKVTVFTLMAIFLYLSIILAFLVADYIVMPLLILRMNVRNTSESLSKMLTSKDTRISPESLTFKDSIKTKDEIRDLSKEIGNMVSVIRGIVPYISVSTLRNAEKNSQTAGTTTRELTFLFTDIRGFTTLCEGLNPKEVVSILNHYLDLETQIILNNNGDVDKFVGDEMMAFFSGPRKEQNACRAAMQIREVMVQEREKRLKEGKPVISIGIGINTGKVVFGSVGAKTRMDFTSIGDTVNLAARLEGANKAYGSKSIISEAVYNRLNDTFICRELDFITVKGKTEPVRIYEILQEKSKSTDKLAMIKEKFEKGLTYYRKQQWDNAEQFFKICAEQYDDEPSHIFMERIKHFRQNPLPQKWDGVFRMTVK